VGWSAGVSVDRGLVIPIHDIQRSIGSHSRMNRAEPKIRAGEKFRIFAADFLPSKIGSSIRAEDVVVNQAHGRFVEKKRIVPLFGPSPAVIDARAGSSREHADPIYLQIRLPFGMDQRRDFLVIGNYRRGPNV